MSSSSNLVDRLRWVVNASLRADGRRAAVAVSWREAERERCVIRVVDVDRGELGETIDGGGTEDVPVWAPAGERLAFVSTREGEPPQLCLWEEGAGAVRLTSEARGVVGAPFWSPDGRLLAIATYVGPAHVPGEPRRVRRASWRFDGYGLVEDEVTELLLVEAAPPYRSWRVGSGLEGLVQPLGWRRGSVLAAVSCRPAAAPGDLQGDLVEIGIDGEVRELDAVRGHGFAAACLPDGRVLYSHHTDISQGWGVSSRLRILGPDGSDGRVAEQLPFEVVGDIDDDAPGEFLRGCRELLHDGETALVRGQKGGTLGIYRVPLAGPERAEELLADPHRSSYPLELRGRRLLYASASLDEPAAVSILDLETLESTAIDPLLDGEKVSLPRLRVTRNREPCENWLVEPTTGAAGPHPTVLFVHGGPHSALGETFIPTVRLLCEAGFAVLMANPTGSRGYGDDFGTAIKGDWGGADAEELLAALDLAIEAGLTDADRVGIAGASYGGYMACLLVGRCDRFAAAVAEDPLTDLVGAVGTMDVGHTFLPGYFEDEEALRRASPLTRASASSTPTLLIHGEADQRCDPSQTYSFYAALRSAGCPAEMLLLPGASHWGKVNGPVRGRRAQEEALVEWFDRHLRA